MGSSSRKPASFSFSFSLAAREPGRIYVGWRGSGMDTVTANWTSLAGLEGDGPADEAWAARSCARRSRCRRRVRRRETGFRFAFAFEGEGWEGEPPDEEVLMEDGR